MVNWYNKVEPNWKDQLTDPELCRMAQARMSIFLQREIEKKTKRKCPFLQLLLFNSGTS
jgi:hypothetical protein